MYCYFLLLWSPGNLRANELATKVKARLTGSSPWSVVMSAPGIALFDRGSSVRGSRTVMLANGVGAVMGRIFATVPELPEVTARRLRESAESDQLVTSRGKILIDRYWGRYVAVVRDIRAHTITILRDPSGGFPCLIAEHDGVTFVVSDLEDCEALKLIKFSVDWRYIGASLTYPVSATPLTGLVEVSELQAGEAITFSDRKPRRELWWNPLEIAQREPIEDFEVAGPTLLHVTRNCVHTWADGHQSIVIALSGGLDSSIVLSCLRRAPKRPVVFGVNHFGKSSASNERHYARLMSSSAGIHLTESLLDSRVLDLRSMQELRASARPWLYLNEMTAGRVEAALAREHGATAIFSGAGGDGVFFLSKAELSVVDYALERGFDYGLLEVATSVARRTGKSVWSLLYQALKARVRPMGLGNPMQFEGLHVRSIVNPEVQLEARKEDRFRPLWLTDEASRRTPPGRLRHALSSGLAPAFYSSFDRADRPETIVPLLSQPIIECCLRIPTYLHTHRSVDRAVARSAFSEDLPPEIVRRYDKGMANDSFRQMLDDNLDFVREILLGGSLATRGYLNRDALEKYLTPGAPPADNQDVEILHNYLGVQSWLNMWEARTIRAA